jgi:(p)ppGpp synthase/HD superfamily hydrolase
MKKRRITTGEFAKKAHDDTNCSYDGKSYYIHLEMVVNVIDQYKEVFIDDWDYKVTHNAGFCHDLIEDAQLTFNNIKDASNLDVAKIVLAVTDVPEENRLMRHLMTMGKTVKDYRAIILKLCDIHANASYSLAHGSSMYEKYVEEYQYRRPIFKKALTWYENYLNMEIVDKLWDSLDEIHGYNK